MHTKTIAVRDATISIWEDWTGPIADAVRDEAFERTRQALFTARAYLESRGWVFQTCPRMEAQLQAHSKDRIRGSKEHRARMREIRAECDARLRADHLVARKGDLELEAEAGGRTAKIGFFQNVAHVVNPNGGRYGFDHFQRMPRELRLRCVVEMVAVARLWEGLGYTINPKILRGGLPLALGIVRQGEGREKDSLSPLERFNDGWGADRFKRGADGWPLPEDTSGIGRACKDRDGVLLAPGETRYLYSCRGHLIRGAVFPNMNGMWTVHAADGTWLDNRSCGDFFTVGETFARRRVLDSAAQAARLRKELAKATEAGNWKGIWTLPAEPGRAA